MVRFPRRGEHDSKPTPRWLYSILLKKGYVDVCIDPTKFDALKEEWNCGKCYCNPPWSRKLPFVIRAVEAANRGKTVILLLPFDPTTRWFKLLWKHNPLVIVPMWRFKGARHPWMLAILGKGEGQKIVLVETWKELVEKIP